MLVPIQSAGMRASMEDVMFSIKTNFWRGKYLQKEGHYLCPPSWSSLLHICFPPGYICPLKGGQ